MPRIRPQTEDEETPGMTPLSRSYKSQIGDTMSRLANRPGKFTKFYEEGDQPDISRSETPRLRDIRPLHNESEEGEFEPSQPQDNGRRLPSTPIRPTEETPGNQPDIYTASAGPSRAFASYRPDEATAQRLREFMANAPTPGPQRPPFDVTNMGKAEGIRAAKPWELFQGERKDAVIADPRKPLANFARIAFPKIYNYLDASPNVRDLSVLNRRSEISGLPNLYKESASGVTQPPTGTTPSQLAVREDMWNAMQNPSVPRLYSGSKSVLAHELQHGLQYEKTPPGQPSAGLPAAQTRGARLQELLKNAVTKPDRPLQPGERKAWDPSLMDFYKQYIDRGYSVPYAIRETLTEAAGRSASRNARNTGRWQQAVKESK